MGDGGGTLPKDSAPLGEGTGSVQVETATMLKWYKIYAGVVGSFGGAKCCGTYQFANSEEAHRNAYEQALMAFETFSSRIRPRSVETIMSEDGLDEELAQEAYLEEVDQWLSYYAEETDGPDTKA